MVGLPIVKKGGHGNSAIETLFFNMPSLYNGSHSGERDGARQRLNPPLRPGAWVALPGESRRGFFGIAVLAIILALSGCATPPPVRPALDADAQAQIARIESYLNGIHSLTARFTETWPNGAVTPGTVYVLRPGRLRLKYDPPAPIEILADGKSLIYHDAHTQQVTLMPLDESPIGLLVQDRVSLSGDVTITDFQHAAGTLRVTLVETRHPDRGSLTLVFHDNPLVFDQWLLNDPRGGEFRITLSEVRENVPIDPAIFAPPPWLPPGA